MRVFPWNAGVAHVLGIQTISNAALEAQTRLERSPQLERLNSSLRREREGSLFADAGRALLVMATRTPPGNAWPAPLPWKWAAKCSALHEPMLDCRGIKYLEQRGMDLRGKGGGRREEINRRIYMHKCLAHGHRPQGGGGPGQGGNQLEGGDGERKGGISNTLNDKDK